MASSMRSGWLVVAMVSIPLFWAYDVAIRLCYIQQERGKKASSLIRPTRSKGSFELWVLSSNPNLLKQGYKVRVSSRG